MPLRPSPNQEEQHTHLWNSTGNVSELRCRGCGYIRISAQEAARRVEEWDAYFQLVRTTPAYQDFQAMSRAWKERNHLETRAVMERVNSRIEKVAEEYNEKENWLVKHDYLPKPSFPDPSTFPLYIITT